MRRHGREWCTTTNACHAHRIRTWRKASGSPDRIIPNSTENMSTSTGARLPHKE